MNGGSKSLMLHTSTIVENEISLLQVVSSSTPHSRAFMVMPEGM